jgi:hypothetical protein
MRNSDFVRLGKFRLNDEVGQGKAGAFYLSAIFAGLQRQIFEERFSTSNHLLANACPPAVKRSKDDVTKMA